MTRRSWSRERIIAAIQDRQRKGLRLDRTWQEDRLLYNAATYYFGSWHPALAAAELPSRPLRKWTKERVLAAMRSRIEQGRPLETLWREDKGLHTAAVAYFGFKLPLGEKLVRLNDDPLKPGSFVTTPCTVIGVVEDFHFESLREAIAPLVLLRESSRGNLAVRMKTGHIATFLEVLKNKWSSMIPGEPFEYAFLDESFNEIYRSEMRTGRIYAIFAALAVIVGCLGLFGLASFSAARRTKEIGIRKALGASIHEMAALLIRDYILLVGLANLMAWPVAYYLMQRWLQNFAYRTSLGLTPFVLSGLLGLTIALLTVGYHAVHAASANPVESLRYE